VACITLQYSKLSLMNLAEGALAGRFVTLIAVIFVFLFHPSGT